MKLNTQKPNDEFRIGPDFFIALVLLSFPTLLIIKPLDWDLPLFSKIAGIIILPTLATFFIYIPIVFIRSYLAYKNTHAGVFHNFFIVSSIVIIFVLITYLTGLNESASSISAVLLSAFAVYALNKK